MLITTINVVEFRDRSVKCNGGKHNAVAQTVGDRLPDLTEVTEAFATTEYLLTLATLRVQSRSKQVMVCRSTLAAEGGLEA